MPLGLMRALSERYAEMPKGEGAGVDVVIAGFGPVGRRVAADLDDDGATYAVIELNEATVRELHDYGTPAVLGDVRTESVLLSAGLDDRVTRGCQQLSRLLLHPELAQHVTGVVDADLASRGRG